LSKCPKNPRVYQVHNNEEPLVNVVPPIRNRGFLGYGKTIEQKRHIHTIKEKKRQLSYNQEKI